MPMIMLMPMIRLIPDNADATVDKFTVVSEFILLLGSKENVILRKVALKAANVTVP